MTAVLVVGIQESAHVNAAIVVIKVSVIARLHRRRRRSTCAPKNWTPFIPPNTGEFGRFGYTGIVRGAAVVFFAYMGFDSVTTAAQEAKNPQRDLPIGILGSLAGCAVLYMLVAIVLTGARALHGAERARPDRRGRGRHRDCAGCRRSSSSAPSAA